MNVNVNKRNCVGGLALRRRYRSERGFSLVELGVVLLVASILIGGVLQGRELIGLGKLQRLEKDLESLQASVSIYRDTYKYLPGDDPSASQRFANQVGITDGNGDYSIDFGSGPSSESRLFWQHLRAARLLKSGADSLMAPRNPFGGEIALRQNVYGVNGLALVATGLSWEDAFALDQRSDDANSGQGQVRIGMAGQALPTPPQTPGALVDLAVELRP